MPTKQTKNSQSPTLAELWASIQPFTPESDEELECLAEQEDL